MSVPDRRFRVGVLALTFLAWGLRLYHLDSQPLRGDEAFSAVVAADITTPEAAVGLAVDPLAPYDYSLHAWIQLTGDSEFSLRMLSVLAGTLAVPLLFRLGTLWGQPSAGLIGALFLAVNPFQVFHSQEARSYAVWIAFDLSALGFYLRALQQNRLNHWLGYGFFAWLALMAHFNEGLTLVFLSIFFLLLWLGLARRGQGAVAWAIEKEKGVEIIIRFTLIQGAVLGSYALYLLLRSAPLVPTAAPASTISALDAVRRLLLVLSFGETLSLSLHMVALLGISVLLVLGLVSAWRKDVRFALFLFLWFAIPWLGTWLYVQWRPIFRERYLNATAPALYLSYALGVLALYRITPRFKPIALLLGLATVLLPMLASLGSYFGPEYQKAPDWPGLVAYLQERTQPNDLVIATYPDPALGYYYRGPATTQILPTIPNPLDQDLHRQLQELLSEHDHVWLIPITSSDWDAEGKVKNWLDRLALRTEEADVAGFWVVHYLSPTLLYPKVQHSSDWVLGNVARLVGYDVELYGEERQPVPTAEFGPGGWLCLILYWEPIGRTQTSYHVFTHLVDAMGLIRGQKDNPPQEGRFPTTLWMPGDLVRDEYWIRIDPAAPQGRYTLLVGMYDFDSGQRLPVYDAHGQPQGDAIPLLQLTVDQ